MNTVDILGHEQPPEEKLEGLKLFVQCHDISEGAGGLLGCEGAGDVVVLCDVLCAVRFTE